LVITNTFYGFCVRSNRDRVSLVFTSWPY